MLEKFVSYKKLGGWLRVFQVLTIISLVIGAFSLISTLVGGQTSMQTGMMTSSYWLYSLLVGVVSIVICIVELRLLGKRDNKLAQVFLILSIISLALSFIGLLIPQTDPVKFAVYMKGVESQLAAAGLDPSMMQASMAAGNAMAPAILIITYAFNIAWMVAWFVYFKKSERVRVYMLDNQAWNEEYIVLRQQWEQQYGGYNGQQSPMPYTTAQPGQPNVQVPTQTSGESENKPE